MYMYQVFGIALALAFYMFYYMYYAKFKKIEYDLPTPFSFSMLQ
jgi:hypothetical protein